MGRKIHGFLLATALVLAAPGCTGLTEGKGKAEGAVARFHQRFNEAGFDAIWDAAGPELQEASPRADFAKLLEAVHRKLGKVTGSQNRGWRLRSHNLRTYVELVQETTFASGTGTESFVFAIRGEETVLVAYDIRSTDLVLK